MAQRTIDEIKQSMYDRQPSKFAELSTSNSAEWDLWVDVVAYAIWLFEGILSIFKADAEDKLTKIKPGTLDWLVEESYKFQYGYDLEVDEKGFLKYPIIDESAKIVKRVSASEADGVITLKVAKYDAQSNLAPLSVDEGELIQFQRYINNIMYAGSKINMVSLEGDSIKYTIDVYFNPVYQENTVTDNILAKLTEYKLGLNNKGLVYRTEFLNKILEAEGVVTAKITLLEGTSGVNTESIDVKYLLVAGYFNYDATSVLNLINNNA